MKNLQDLVTFRDASLTGRVAVLKEMQFVAAYQGFDEAGKLRNINIDDSRVFKGIRDRLLDLALTEIEAPIKFDNATSIYGKYCTRLPDDVILGNKTTFSKLVHFLKDAHHVRLYGDDDY